MDFQENEMFGLEQLNNVCCTELPTLLQGLLEN